MTAPTFTDPDDPVRLFRAALPPWAVHDLDWTEQVIIDIHAAIAAGWTVGALVERVTDHARGYYNADQVMRHRLHTAAHPETTEQ